jgi:PIN domain nuclease of toxin-antitoxin system
VTKVLLDTHVFLWALDEPERLPRRWLEFFDSSHVELFLSAASAWEISIKCQLKKLRLPLAPADYLQTRCAELGVEPVPITFEHACAITALPQHHRDPFDRMLVAQAAIEGLTLATLDPVFLQYDVRRLSVTSALTRVAKLASKTPRARVRHTR